MGKSKSYQVIRLKTLLIWSSSNTQKNDNRVASTQSECSTHPKQASSKLQLTHLCVHFMP